MITLKIRKKTAEAASLLGKKSCLYIPGHMVLKNTSQDVGAAENVGKHGVLVTELEGNSSERLWVVIPNA